MLPFEPPALRSTSPTRPRSFASPARTHARHEHETKPKPISRLGSAAAYFPTTSDIYTSVNPCISMHDAKRNRVQWLRAECNRDQHLRIVISNSSLEQYFRSPRCTGADQLFSARAHRPGGVLQTTWWLYTV